MKEVKDDLFDETSIENTHYSTVRQLDVDCSNLDKEADAECEKIYLMRMRVLDPGDYLFRIEIKSLLDWQPYTTELQFQTEAVSEAFVATTVTVRIVLFCFSLVIVIMFEWQFFKLKPAQNQYRYEMNWTRALNYSLLLYLEPVSAVHFINPSPFS